MERNAMRIAVAAASVCMAGPAWCDEGGVSFWLPGQMGSLAAVPGEPGWSLPMVYIHNEVDASGSRTFSRGGRITAGVDGTADLLLAVPTYTFATPVWGGRASLGLGVGGGRMKAGVNATLTGPGGSVVSGSESDTVDGVTDLYPTGSIKWNRGVHNYMVYGMAGAPVGKYSTGSLANLGLNHWSLDGGVGYTYMDLKGGTGNEFSAVLGLTYNFENDDTQYRNGNNVHLDWAASHFFSPKLHAGLAGYYYDQFTGDSGSGATLGDFKSRVYGLGPQVGYFFEANGRKYYANLKAYGEFNARNRPEGWSLWLSLAIPLGK